MKTKALVLTMLLFGALCFTTFSVSSADAANDTVCVYCKSRNYGDCGAAPSSADNPKRKHKHQSNGQNCVWCGAQAKDGSCSMSPTDKHQL